MPPYRAKSFYAPHTALAAFVVQSGYCSVKIEASTLGVYFKSLHTQAEKPSGYSCLLESYSNANQYFLNDGLLTEP